jgi:orotidine-5'-phosphate decarboxylase
VSGHFADRLLAAIEAKGSPVCVGLDPRPDRLPEPLAPRPPADPADACRAVDEFCRGVLEAVAPVVPAVKPQIAYFEALGPPGVRLYYETVQRARALGLMVIGDVKRGDIGPTAEAYAAAHLRGDDRPDAVTVSGYFGADGLAPFIEAARGLGRGVFVLVRTSNRSAAAVQDFAGASGRPFYEHVAEQVAAAGDADALRGERGYSCVGAVVAATYPREARRLREVMPHQVFLVPGYGAQGAGADDCAAAFRTDGTGAIVNASRSVIYAFAREEYAGLDWPDAVAAAARAFAEDVAAAVVRHRDPEEHEQR